MTDVVPDEPEPAVPASDRRHRWDAIGVVIASLVGLLALLVSGYTAYIQRQQVRAQVWPYLTRGYVEPPGTGDSLYKLAIFNKGVGPAIVRSVEITVDGKPQVNWKGVFDTLGLSSLKWGYSTLNGNVLSPGESLPTLVFDDDATLSRFRRAMQARARMHVCYCSTLGECWMFVDRKLHGEADVQPIARCPKLSGTVSFRN